MKGRKIVMLAGNRIKLWLLAPIFVLFVLASVDVMAENKPSNKDFSHTRSDTKKTRTNEISSMVDHVTGRSSYTIPLQLPPGTGGMMPSLTLAYSSGNGVGFVGKGWSIGLPAIDRSIKYGSIKAFELNNDEGAIPFSGHNVLRFLC